MKKAIKKGMSFVLGFLMIFMSIPVQIASTESTNHEPIEVQEKSTIDNAMENLTTIKGIREIVSLREEHVKHFQMPDGTMQAIVFPNAIHEKDENGSWQPIDSTVSLASNRDGKMYVSKDGKKQFSTSAANNQSLYTLAENGYSITVSLANTLAQDSSKVSAEAKTAIVTANAPNYNTEWDSVDDAISSAINQSTVTYPSVYPNTDIEYTMFGDAIKENIVLKSASCATTYKFKYHLEGLKAILNENGSISFHDVKTDELRYRIPAPYMYDQNGEISRDVYYALHEENDGSYLISVIASDAWLKDNARAYPVRIDPTIVSSSKVNDTFVSSSSPNTSYGDSIVRISPSCTGFIQAIMPTLPSGASITRATLVVYYYYASGVTGNRTIAAYQMNEPWDEINTTYNVLFNTHGSSLGISSTLLNRVGTTASSNTTASNPRKLSFMVTSAVNSWYNGVANYGIALKHNSGSLQSTSGSNTDTIIQNYEAFSDYTAYFSIMYDLPSGVYAIKKNGSTIYAKNNTVDPLAWVFQESLTSLSMNEANRDYMFKFAYRPETDDYVIRAMSNNEIIIYPSLAYSKPLAGRRVISGSPATDANLPTTYTWKITSSLDGYDQIWYQEGTTKYYLCSAFDDDNSRLTLTTDPNDAGTQWVFHRYEGETFKNTVQISYSDHLMLGETYDYNMGLYSTVIGQNGPITYSVTDRDDSPTEKATIDSATGVLTAQQGGIVRISWTYSGAPYIWSRLITICANRNLISIKNTSNNKYITPLTSYVDSNIITDEFSNSNTTMMWYFEYNGDGYYKIKNFVTGYYLKAPSNNTDGASVTESSYSSTYSLWKLERTADGYYIIQSKNQYERTTSSPLYLTVNGDNVVQSNVYDTNKWVVFPYEFDLTLNIYYDQAFNVRYGDGNSLIKELESEMQNLLWKTANIRLIFNPPLQIASTPDTCKTYRNLTLNLTTINEICPANPSLDDPDCAYHNHNLNNDESCENCTSWLQIYRDFIEEYPGSNTTSILFTGNKLYNNAGQQCNRSYLWYNNGICIQEIQDNYSEYQLEMVPFIMHEIAHSIDAPDHYHEAPEGERCKNEALCIECHPETGRPTWCLMSDGWLYEPYNEEFLWCDDCYNEVMLYLIDHHND